MGIYFKLLGGPVITRPNGDMLRLPTRKSEAMLAYLVERRQEAISRDVLAGLLWPYSAEEQARASLRQEISVLRKALGPKFSELVITEGDRVALAMEGLEADIWHIRDRRGISLAPDAVLNLLDLYTAPFLDTFRIRSQPFSDWAYSTRQTIESELLNLGQEALLKCIERQDANSTVEIARHLCRIEPTFEVAHRAIITHYLSTGDDTAALRQLQQCESALRTTLDLDVSDETRQLFKSIMPAAKPTPVPTKQIPQGPSMPQRRFITALSVLVKLGIDDPEDFDCAAEALTSKIQESIQSNGGIVLQISGDHVLACFGYPVGHDSDPDSAVFAALAVLELFEVHEGDVPNCHVGLSYGQALFSAPADGSAAALKFSGPVFHAAEAVCYRGPTAVVIVDQALENVLTTAIMLDYIPGEPLAKRALPRHQFGTHNYQNLVPEQTHPMVGREAPFDHLLGLLEQAKGGQGSVTAVLGDAGEGKSRLVQEIVEKADSLGFEVRIFKGNHSQRKSTLAPLLDHMFRTDAIAGRTVTSCEVEHWLSSLGPNLKEAAPYIESLIMDPEKEILQGQEISKSAKEAALNIFAAQVLARNQNHPICLIFEDIHWFDPTTCLALANLIDIVPDAAALVVLVSRNDEAPDIVNHPFVWQVALTPLQPQYAETLLRGLLADTSISEKTIKNILERAEGNPLILEEFAKSVAFRKANSNGFTVNEAVNDLPGRLLPLLLSRIDSVSGAIEALQYASVFGRSFSKDQLTAVQHTTITWAAVSQELEEAGIIFSSKRGGDTFYVFKHALISEAIYATIPKRARPAMHIAAAQTLLVNKQRIAYAEVARHFKSAEAYEMAAQYFELSGDQAARVSSFTEAISEYGDAIVMIENTTKTPVRLRKELSLNRKTAAQMIALHGIPTSEVTQFYAKAQKLSAQLGDNDEVVNAAWGLWSIHLIVAELDQCSKTAVALGPVVDKLNTPTARLIHQYMLGVTHAYRGSLSLAAGHLETVLSIYNEELKDDLQMRFGMDIGLTANSFLGWVYALLGRPQDADLAAGRALQMAETNDNGLSYVFAHVFTATKCLFLNQLKDARHHAELAVTWADAMGFKHWNAQARMQLARIADLSGEADALEAFQQAREDYLSTGMVLARSYADVWIADAQNRNNQPHKALETLNALGKFTNASNQRYFEFAAQNTRVQVEQSIALDLAARV